MKDIEIREQEARAKEKVESSLQGILGRKAKYGEPVVCPYCKNGSKPADLDHERGLGMQFAKDTKLRPVVYHCFACGHTLEYKDLIDA